MFPKKNRADTKTVEKIFKARPSTGREGKILNSLSLAFRYIKSNDREKKISFIAPKSIAKLAVKRNLLRRRGYTALEKNFQLLPAGITGVFIFKKYQEDISILENEIKNILDKIN